jgi:hypothetical protein
MTCMEAFVAAVPTAWTDGIKRAGVVFDKLKDLGETHRRPGRHRVTCREALRCLSH